ncbi:uncharacterized protein LOC130436093 [Triplophysa dalaica]|uniref:uncharacterized protein LOC130436093 n=1 Tax=Triplophysa dalaica TaxID=1582913 RepID=UPI0024DF924E|nr:uncharacterized protein LOC130436093 [Triplophysa dalaica]
MKFFFAVCSWICLSGFGISATDGTHINGREGGQVTVPCTHSWASTNRKYFCRDPCTDRDILVSSDRSPNKRFSLKTFPRNGTFTVTITGLQESDSGIYWCGVDRVGADTYNRVTLKVSKAGRHTTQRTPTPVTKPEPQTSTSRSFSPAPDDITNSVSCKGDIKPVEGPILPKTSEDQTFFDKTGLLLCTAVGLTVMLLILGVILYVYKKKKRKSHRPSGTTAAEADTERGITITKETACDYEDITETQQRTHPHTPTTVYSAINHRSAANQIQDSSLYSNLPIQPSCRDQTTDMVTYASIDLRKNQGPQSFRSEDTVTYDTVVLNTESSHTHFRTSLDTRLLQPEIRSSSTDEIVTRGYTGKNITVSCQHSWALNNRKYFCRDPCGDRDVIVSSDRSSKGRFSLKYLGKGTFTVTITDLQETDSGIYWCGVDRTFKDTYHKVYLTVYKANTHHVTPTSTELYTTRPLPTPTRQPESSFATSRKPSRSLTSDDITRSPSMTGLLVCIAVGLTVMLLIFGVILCVYIRRKSHSSSGSPAADADAERHTTITTETAGVYEEITETQQWTDLHTLSICIQLSIIILQRNRFKIPPSIPTSPSNRPSFRWQHTVKAFWSTN